jgi:hypothetical protein
MDTCLFCTSLLTPGSEEHVFLAALGGRLATRRATCVKHNNHFASKKGGQVDDALAEAFALIRCALLIWTGRNQPPPTLRRAGRIPDGPEYDLGPGLVPLSRPAAVPDFSSVAPDGVVTVSASNLEDARRIFEIAEKRGLKPILRGSQAVTRRVPETTLNLSFEGPRIWRAVAKTAVTGSCVLFGNAATRATVNPTLLSAIRDGVPEISTFGGWDYTNPWPVITKMLPHKNTPTAQASGFEHSLVLADVGDDWVAYVEFFGAFRFSVRVGARSGHAPKGLAVNPRSRSASRFVLEVIAPLTYTHRTDTSFKDEHSTMSGAMEASVSKVLTTWNTEATHAHIENLAEELVRDMQAAGDDEEGRATVTARWAQKIAHLEVSGTWTEELDRTMIDDDAA